MCIGYRITLVARESFWKTGKTLPTKCNEKCTELKIDAAVEVTQYACAIQYDVVNSGWYETGKRDQERESERERSGKKEERKKYSTERMSFTVQLYHEFNRTSAIPKWNAAAQTFFFLSLYVGDFITCAVHAFSVILLEKMSYSWSLTWDERSLVST